MESTPDEKVSRLGFPPLTPVTTFRSVGHLFRASKKRCGIYCLAFENGMFYIGQSINAARRFSEHRRVHEDIVGFTFQPIPAHKLDEIEVDLIHEAESLGLRITNSAHASTIEGDSDLDDVIPTEQQSQWIVDPYSHNQLDETASRIVLPLSQQERFSTNYTRFQSHPLFNRASALLQQYLTHCIPYPKTTEYSFWSVSCMPSSGCSICPLPTNIYTHIYQ